MSCKQKFCFGSWFLLLGIFIGFLIAPIKKGFTFTIYNSEGDRP